MTRPQLLVVDDEPVIHELIREVMDEYDVVAALTIAETRAVVARGEAFDVAIVDKNLPDGSGLALVGWLRAQRADCEVLTITGYPSMDSAVEAINAGATDYLIKPMRDIAELRLRVGNACERVRRRRAEQQLLENLHDSEERYRELFEATPDALLVLDSGTRVVIDVNAAAERLYGRPSDQLIGTAAQELTAPRPAPEIQNGIIVRREKRANGELVPVEVSTTITRRAGRSIVVEVVRDVSERERAAAEKLALEQRLTRSDRLEALGRLAAGIAHDFNNLLCVIGVGTELALESEGIPAAAVAELAQVEAAVRSATDLTRQLLAFSGRQVTRSQNVDINARVEAVARMLDRTLGVSVKVVLDLADDPIIVQIDPSHLEQVVTNLAVNARDAMPDGGTVTLATRPETVDAVQGVLFSVRDTGTGISPDVAANIFDPFFSTKGPERGTGLGLATVREIVNRSSGKIDVISKVGEGTRFEIWLPVSDGAIYETTQFSMVVPAGRGEAVLVIDDNAQVRELIRRVLVGAGYAVHGVGSGEEALAHLTAGSRFDVVVADLELPGITGVECAKRIMERDRQVRVLYTSGMASDPRGKAAQTRGASFLAKPYSPEQLMRSVRRALDDMR